MISKVPEKRIKAYSGEWYKENNDARISRAAACKRLGKTPSSLYRWEQAAKLHPIKIGRSTYYMEREIIDIEEGRI